MIGEAGDKRVRMAHLATVGTHAINGVAELHSGLLKQTVMRDFAELWPERFYNVTNGVTPRRFLVLAIRRSPNCSTRRSAAVGSPISIACEALESHAGDAGFRERWRRVKRAQQGAARATYSGANERRGRSRCMFDMQVKRIHEYKRQHLNLLHVIALWRRLREHPESSSRRACFVFAGKAAPGYRLAKLMIRLVTGVAAIATRIRASRDRMQVVFIPTSTSRPRSASIRPPICPSKSRRRAKKRRAPAT